MSTQEFRLGQDDSDWKLYENLKERRYDTHIPEGAAADALRVTVNTGSLGSGGGALEIATGGPAIVNGTEHNINAQPIDIPAGNSFPRRDVVYITDAGGIDVATGAPAKYRHAPGVATGQQTVGNAYLPAPRDFATIEGLPLAVVAVPGSNATSLNTGNDILRDVRVREPPTAQPGDVIYVEAGDSIEDAIADNTDGGRIEVAKSYDPSVETPPITTDKAIAIVGPGAFSERIFDFTGMGPYAFEIVAGGMGIFRRPSFQNLSISGAGYKITQGNPAFQNGVVNHGPEHGFYWPDDANIKFNPQVRNCIVESVTGDGYHVAGRAHSLQLFGIVARHCGGRGLYTGGPPANISVWGGDFERNQGRNIEINSYAATISSAYIERGEEGGTAPNKEGVYLGGECNTVENCYHQAGNASASITDVAVVLDGPRCEVRGGHYTNYAEGFVRVDAGAVDADIHATSHYADTGAPLLAGDAGTRTRSNGVIGGPGLGGADLSAVTGQTAGDVALSDGTIGRAFVPAAWTGSQWRTSAAEDTVAAAVYLSANQTIASGTITKIGMDTAKFDSRTGFNAANNNYSVPEDGLYALSLDLRLLDLAAGQNVQPQIYVNGNSEFKKSKAGEYAGVTGRIGLSEGDTVDWRVFHNDSASRDLRGVSNVTFGEIERIGSL